MEFACYADWAQLPASANELFASAAQDSVFFSRPWFDNLIANGLEDGHSLLLACVLEGDRVLALLPLYERERGYCYPLRHLYTSLFTLLIVESHRQDILRCLARGLKRLEIVSLRLDPIAEDDQDLLDLQKAMESSGFSCERYFLFYNWIHRLQGQSFADYLTARPARVRNTVARKKRKLEREHECRIRLFTGADLQQGMADYKAAYNASWKAHEVFGAFVTGLADNLSRFGWLRLAILYINQQPAAAQFWFVAHGKASIFKLAYDEAWKRYSPGTILIAYLMEYAIDVDKVHEIDFLMGNDAYKQDWMSERRVRWRLCCGNTDPAVPRRARGIWPLGAWLKRLKQSLYNPDPRKPKESGNGTST